MKHKIFTTLSLLLVCALLFGACSNRPDEPAEPEASATPEATAEPVIDSTPEPTPEVTPEPTPEPTATPEPTPEVPLVNPLTGETSTKDYSRTRPVAIMVENNHWDPTITPIQQGSISQADIVYEAQVEQITRNMFVFMDLDGVGNINPVRSCRSYFVSTALAYDAIFAHCGESADGLEFSAPMLANYTDNDNININEDNGTGFRIMDYPYSGAVHSMTTTGERLQTFIAENNTRTEHNTDSYDYGLHFTENAAPTDGSAAANVRIVFPGTKITTFEYKADKNGYVGFNWNAAIADANTNDAPAFQNLLVLSTYTQTGIDDHYHTAMNTYECEGTGLFFNGGYCEPITWKRGAVTEPFRYYTADGNELSLGVGRTYIAFVSSTYGGATYN